MTMSGVDGHGVVDAVVALATERSPAGGTMAPDAAAFVRRYYERVAAEDLVDDRPDDLYGAAMAHRQAARCGPPAPPIVRIYNPEVDTDGWQSPHTVVDIVTDDMPFLVDSVTMVLAAHHLGVHVVVHPIFDVARDDDGRFVGLGEGHPGEAWIHLEVDRQGTPPARATLEADIRRSLGDVRVVVDDWMAMRERAMALVDEVDAGVPVLPTRRPTTPPRCSVGWPTTSSPSWASVSTTSPSRTVTRCFAAGPAPASASCATSIGPRAPSASTTCRPRFATRCTSPTCCVVTKANSRSTVHRADYFAYVGVKRLGPDGRVLGERRFLGLWNAATYRSTTAEIPLLGRKVAAVRLRAGLPPDSHGGRELWNILETYPRDDLFQISEDELLATALEHPQPAGAPPGPAVRPPGRLRPLRLVPHLRAAGAVLDHDRRADGGDPARELRRGLGRVRLQHHRQRAGSAPRPGVRRRGRADRRRHPRRRAPVGGGDALVDGRTARRAGGGPR